MNKASKINKMVSEVFLDQALHVEQQASSHNSFRGHVYFSVSPVDTAVQAHEKAADAWRKNVHKVLSASLEISHDEETYYKIPSSITDEKLFEIKELLTGNKPDIVYMNIHIVVARDNNEVEI